MTSLMVVLHPSTATSMNLRTVACLTHVMIEITSLYIIFTIDGEINAGLKNYAFHILVEN